MNILSQANNFLLIENSDNSQSLFSYGVLYITRTPSGDFIKECERYSATSIKHVNKAFEGLNMNKKKFESVALGQTF